MSNHEANRNLLVTAGRMSIITGCAVPVAVATWELSRSLVGTNRALIYAVGGLLAFGLPGLVAVGLVRKWPRIGGCFSIVWGFYFAAITAGSDFTPSLSPVFLAAGGLVAAGGLLCLVGALSARSQQ